jgi:hypothetical protein
MTEQLNSLGTVKVVKRDDVPIKLQGKQQQTIVNDIPVYASSSSDYVDPRDVPTSAIGHCERFNLTDDCARKEYAELAALFATSGNLEKLFEERTSTSNGDLIIYIAYIEYVKITEV